MTALRQLALVAACLIMAACESTSSLYYWGSYEGLVYDMYNRPGQAPPELQIDKLSADIERARDSGRKIAPGVHAHLGLMYPSVGNLAAAEAAFHNEKTLYPESATLLDGMLQRAHAAEAGQKPGKPKQSEKLGQSAKPAQSAKPEQPVKPAQPVKPEQKAAQKQEGRD